MKLSEAIEAALTLNIPQARGGYFKEVDGRLCACAVGQALLGAGLVSLSQAYDYASLNSLGPSAYAASEFRGPGFSALEVAEIEWPDSFAPAISLNDASQEDLPGIIERLEAEGY